MDPANVLIAIPARMASTRFPGKPLTPLAGRPMVMWVHAAAAQAYPGARVCIATPDAEIADVARAHGAEVEMTRPDHPSGTDRIAEIAARTSFEVYVNVQGDEPLIAPESIRDVIEPFRSPEVQMTSVYAPCEERDFDDPAVVKVVLDRQGRALYFSRYPIPYPRHPRPTGVNRHIGLYAFRRDVLQEFPTWPQTPLELAESLEQLRFLENGVKIAMIRGQAAAMGVDTPEQAVEVARLLESRTGA